MKATYSPFDLVCSDPPGTAVTAVPAIGLRRLYRLYLLVLEADRWNEAGADSAPALFLTTCVWLWRLCWGDFHRQGDSPHLECSPVVSGHFESEIIQPREETVPLRITCV